MTVGVRSFYCCAFYQHGALLRARLLHAKLLNRLPVEPAPEVRAIDFMNLTENAQLSDGVHYRTDVNLAKAHVVLRLMELVAEEGVAKLRAEEGPPRAWPTLTDGCDAQDRALGRCGGLVRR